MCHHAAVVVQILFATRKLGLSEPQIGLSFVGLGAGAVLARMLGHPVSSRIGPGPCLLLDLTLSALGWLLRPAAPANAWGRAAFALMLFLFGVGAVLAFINFLALRQAVTPTPLLGRMTTTIRWLTPLPAGPGARIGGWLGEHLSLRASLALAGGGALLTAAAAWRLTLLSGLRARPQPQDANDA